MEIFYGMGRFLLIGFAVLGAILGYLYTCGQIYKVSPRVGMALVGVVIAGVGAIAVGVCANLFVGRSAVLVVLGPAYAITLVGWIVLVFKVKQSWLDESKPQ